MGVGLGLFIDMSQCIMTKDQYHFCQLLDCAALCAEEGNYDVPPGERCY